MPKKNNSQDFLFSRANKATETFEVLESKIFKELSKNLKVDAKGVAEFKKLAMRNKKEFIKQIKILSKDHKKIFSQQLSKEIVKMSNDGLSILDGAISDIEKEAKVWKANKVSNKDEFLNKNLSKTIIPFEKRAFKDIELAMSNTLNNLNRRYSHIVNEISMNVSKLNNNEIFISNLRNETIKSLNKVANVGLPRAAGKMDIVSYSEMAARANFKESFNKQQNIRYKEYKIDLVITNYLSDSSLICDPWQGEIYSQNGNSNKYESIIVAENAGHLTHINCRHMKFPYVPNISTKPEKVSSAEVKKNRENRLKQRYNERQIRKWKRKDAVQSTPFTRGKIREWQQRQIKLLKQNPAMSRDYSREKILGMVNNINKNKIQSAFTPIKIK